MVACHKETTITMLYVSPSYVICWLVNKGKTSILIIKKGTRGKNGIHFNLPKNLERVNICKNF